MTARIVIGKPETHLSMEYFRKHRTAPTLGLSSIRNLLRYASNEKNRHSESVPHPFHLIRLFQFRSHSRMSYFCDIDLAIYFA